MKKCISIILIFTILINAFFPNYIFAKRQNSEEVTNRSAEESDASVKGLMESGEVSLPTETSGGGTTNSSKKITETGGFGGWVASVLVILAFPIVYVFRILITLVAPANTTYDGSAIPWFTIQGLLTGEIDILDLNIFSIIGDVEEGKVIHNIKVMVRNWYYAVWILSVICNLIMLIYIGIRMAMSTVAGQKATYKSKLIGWFESMILLFTLHIIIRIIFWASDIMVDLLRPILTAVLTASGTDNLEMAIFADLGPKILNCNGWKPIEGFLCYALLVIYQFKFFRIYMKRFLTTCFLVTISPLVTVTYSMDKAGDGQPQAFQAMIRELITNIFLQPMHLLLYIVLMGLAANIIQEFPLFAVLLLIGVTKGEKIIKEIFKMNQSVTVEAIDNKEEK